MDALGIKRLIVDLMRNPASVDAERLAALSDDDWSELEELARENRCGPYLASVLSHRDNIAERPALPRMRKRSVFRNLDIGKECLAIHNLLEEAGIAHLFLKGVPLAFRDYPEPWMRPMRDIDVLVKESAVQRAYDLLLSKGEAIEAFSHMPMEPTERGKHLPPIQSPGAACMVELHYRVLSPSLALPGEAIRAFEQEIWHAPSTVSIGGSPLPVPSDEMLLIHMVIHGMLDHELNNGPLFITDIKHLLEGGRIDESRLSQLVERTGTRRAFALTTQLLPPDAQQRLAFLNLDEPDIDNDIFVSLLIQPPKDRYQLKMMAEIADNSASGKLALLARKAFPSIATMRARWTFDHGSQEGMPDNPAALWLWFISSRVNGLFSKRAGISGTGRDSLISLRRALAAPPHDSDAAA